MGRHMRKHATGTATRIGVSRPVWQTLDRQQTEPFAVNIARCKQCGDSLRAVAGGTWVGRRTNDAVCHRSRRWPWSSRQHILDATPPDHRYEWWVLALLIAIVGPVTFILAAVFATWLGHR